jgi:multiple sugar transport system permease protein
MTETRVFKKETKMRMMLRKSKWFLGKLALYVLLIELVYVIIFPFITKISASFMSESDMFDRTVNLIPKSPTLENFRVVLEQANYWSAIRNTFILALCVAIVQTFICAMTGYGLSKLRGKSATLVLGLVLMTVLIPPQVVLVPLFLSFRFFDVFGIMGLAGNSLNLIDSVTPLAILSLTGFGLKNGLYILVMRQFFKGVPEEIEEAAMLDGAGAFRSYMRVVLPVSGPMLTTIFMLSFCWQWTDTFYSNIFFARKIEVIARSIFLMPGVTGGNAQTAFQLHALLHTGVFLAIIPLILVYAVAQRRLVTGLERSGIVG